MVNQKDLQLEQRLSYSHIQLHKGRMALSEYYHRNTSLLGKQYNFVHSKVMSGCYKYLQDKEKPEKSSQHKSIRPGRGRIALDLLLNTVCQEDNPHIHFSRL